MKKYKLAVYIGRFQPFHVGHQYVIDEAFKVADKVLILVGSANASRSIKNPFTYTERKELILGSVTQIVNIEALDDFTYEPNQWVTEVQSIVEQYEPNSKDVVLVGHSKDDSSMYLKWFPQYANHEVAYHEMIDATQIRELWYQGKFKFIQSALSKSVYNSLVDFSKKAEYNVLSNEYNYVKKYKESWVGTPYPVIFQAVDAIVIQSGHILLIERGNNRGIGLWALPGGFLDINETLEQGCIRELREETKLKIPVPVLKGSIKLTKTFDKPDRSNIGRIITTAFLIQLDNTQDLPKVSGGDDAKTARWIPLAEFYNMPELMFSDHYFIITKVLDNT